MGVFDIVNILVVTMSTFEKFCFVVLFISELGKVARWQNQILQCKGDLLELWGMFS